jgi:hypothetical protein
MAWLLRPARVVSVNVESPADVVAPRGDRLPFDDGSFDAVTSTDVLEHIPADERQHHIDELVRVCRRRIVMCCPWGSPEKEAAEQRMADRLRDELNITLEFLEEHIELGLPRETDIRGMFLRAAPGARFEAHYQDGLEYGIELVMDGMRAARRKDPRALGRFVWRAYVRRDVRLEPTSSTDTSRLFLVVDL